MNFCQAHWDELKERINEFGLSKYIADDGKQAVEHLMREVEGGSTVVDFEPLLGASMAMATRALQIIGLAMMQSDHKGERRCPVCAMAEYDWVEAAAWQSVLDAKKRGLITEDEERALWPKCRQWRTASRQNPRRSNEITNSNA